MTRQQANEEIMGRLLQAIMENPDQRFGQILRNLGIVTEIRDETHMPICWQNDFNKESEAILESIKYNAEYAE